MKFTRYYVCSAVSAPSRYNVLAGRCASRSLRQQGRKFPPGGPVNIGWEAGVLHEPYTLARVLKTAGYATGMVGKWLQGTLEPSTGFAEDADPEDPMIQEELKRNYEVLVRTVKSTGFDFAEALYLNNVGSAKRPGPFWIPRKLRYHNMEWVTACALEFIEENKGRPFFLYVSPTLVHSPSAVESLLSDRRTTPLGYLDVSDVQPSRQSVLDRARRASADGNRQIIEKAAGSIWLDDGVGALLERLDDLGLAQKTFVLLASDNGNLGKFTCYDEGARVPMVARWRGVIPAGAVCDKLVSNLDFAPTVLQIAGVDPPPRMVLDGQSILTALEGDPSYRRESLFLEITTERAVVTDDGFKYIAVRYPPQVQEQVDRGKKFNHFCEPFPSATHTFGAVERYPGYFDQDQLYDLNTDPEERENLVAEPAQRIRLGRMKELLRRYSATLPHTFGEFKKE
jgi:arylsulfatase A-like enzyme